MAGLHKNHCIYIYLVQVAMDSFVIVTRAKWYLKEIALKTLLGTVILPKISIFSCQIMAGVHKNQCIYYIYLVQVVAMDSFACSDEIRMS